MPSTQFAESLNAIADRLILLAAEDEALRQQLRELAEAILNATAEPETAEVAVTSVRDTATVPEQLAPPARPAEPVIPAQQAVQQLRLGGARPVESHAAEPRIELPAGYAPSQEPSRVEIDLEIVERRCRLKVEASRWAATRQRRLAEGGVDMERDLAPRDREFQTRALDLPHCYLWMAPPDGPIPEDLALLEMLADCYETLADAIAFMRSAQGEMETHRDFFEAALRLLAEAQSTVRGAVHQLDGPEDYDQKGVFLWLRRMTREHSVYVERYMQARDIADPTRHAELAERISQEEARFEETRSSSKTRRKLLNKIRYLAQQIATDFEHSEHWPTLVETVVQLVDSGTPPSDRGLRELLLPIIEHLPEGDDPPTLKLVLREMDRYLLNSTAGERLTAAPERSEEVRRAAELLRGKSVFLIGGERRNHAYDALMTALELEELIWFPTREHESVSIFESYVARPEVVVVLLAIRWSSHSYGEVKAFCEEYGKPLVRLPAGYNPNQVASQLLAQAGERLRNADPQQP